MGKQLETSKQRMVRLRAWIVLLEDVEAAIDRDVAQERRVRFTGRYSRWLPDPSVRRARERIHARLLGLRKQLREVE
jgi:hypothetical protein